MNYIPAVEQIADSNGISENELKLVSLSSLVEHPSDVPKARDSALKLTGVSNIPFLGIFNTNPILLL